MERLARTIACGTAFAKPLPSSAVNNSSFLRPCRNGVAERRLTFQMNGRISNGSSIQPLDAQ
jgi:hypothetical protein